MSAYSVADHLRQMADLVHAVPRAGAGKFIDFNNSVSVLGLIRSKVKQLGLRPKVGTTAGWVVAAANNLGTLATLPISQTASTLVVYLSGLEVGDTITGFTIYSSINSTGSTVTLDAQLRKIVPAAGATGTDSLVTNGSITQVSVTAATASTATKTGLSEVVVAGVQYYLLLTGTTGVNGTIEFSMADFTLTSS